MRQAIQDLLSTETTRRKFQVNVLLQCVKSKGMYEGLTENLEIYLNHVRKMFPTPQLVQVGKVGLSAFFSDFKFRKRVELLQIHQAFNIRIQ